MSTFEKNMRIAREKVAKDRGMTVAQLATVGSKLDHNDASYCASNLKSGNGSIPGSNQIDFAQGGGGYNNTIIVK